MGQEPVLAGSGWTGTKDQFASGRWALTGSRPSADVTFIMLRVADLAAALLDRLFEQPAGDPVPARDFPQPGISVVSESFLNHSLRTLW